MSSSIKKSLETTGPSPVRDFIINSNGHTFITKILIGMYTSSNKKK